MTAWIKLISLFALCCVGGCVSDSGPVKNKDSGPVKNKMAPYATAASSRSPSINDKARLISELCHEICSDNDTIEPLEKFEKPVADLAAVEAPELEIVPLTLAANKNKPCRLRWLLERGQVKCNINGYSKIGATVAHYAIGADGDSTECLEVLEAFDADFTLQKKDEHGVTPCMLAANKNKPFRLRWLLERDQVKRHINDYSKTGATVVHCAIGADGDSTECLEVLTAFDADFTLQKKDEHGLTPCMLAVVNNKPGRLRWLLERDQVKRHINDYSKIGATVEHWAIGADGDATECLEVLKEFGADFTIQKKDEHGTTPLMLAAVNNKPGRLRWLLERDQVKSSINDRDQKGLTAVHYAVTGEDDSTACLAVFEEFGADFTLENEKGVTLLMRAAGHNKPRQLRWLLERDQVKRNINNSSREVFVAIYCALVGKDDSTACLAVFEEFGADFMLETKDGETPLMRAAKHNKPRQLRWLLERDQVKSSINGRDQKGLTAVHYAVTGKDDSTACLAVFEEFGAYFTLENEKGVTPLMRAAEHNKPRQLRWLLERDQVKSSINDRDQKGLTAVHYAVTGEDDSTACLAVFEEFGADFTLETEDRETPLMLARNKNKPCQLKWLTERYPSTWGV